jgi:hypothetical protein
VAKPFPRAIASHLSGSSQLDVRRRARPRRTTTRHGISQQAARARRKFLKRFPGGFRDPTYLEWERGYKWNAHRQWMQLLGEDSFRRLLKQERYAEIAAAAIRIESRTNLLFSFEKIALRDAVRSDAGAKRFALGLFTLLHGAGPLEERFTKWVTALDALPRPQTRVVTWPIVTVFAFIAQPRVHFFFKPTVTREAARRYRQELEYGSRPTWDLYKGLLNFVRAVRADLQDLHPRDMIDIQSFLWVQGSDEYPD